MMDDDDKNIVNDQSKSEEQTNYTKLTLKEVQNMQFPEEEQKPVVYQAPPQEDPLALQKKRDRYRLLFRKLKPFIKLAIFLTIVTVLYLKYNSYSLKADQVLTFEYHNTIFEFTRDSRNVKVVQKEEICENECVDSIVDEYNINFGKVQMFLLRTYFDITFRFQNGIKTIHKKDLTSGFGGHSVYSMIHNDPKFLSFNQYRRYEVLSSEQKSENTIRGFQYLEDKGHLYLIVSLGKKDTVGYVIDLYEIHKENDHLTVYVTEDEPKENDKWLNVSYPAINIELDEKPVTITVINIRNKEVFQNYDDIGFGN